MINTQDSPVEDTLAQIKSMISNRDTVHAINTFQNILLANLASFSLEKISLY